MTTALEVWQFDIPADTLTPPQRDYLLMLPVQRPSVEWVWGEMDRVWDAQGLGNGTNHSPAAIAAYYSHPVWMLNGIFTETDPESTGHRAAIADWIGKLDVRDVADYGGGFGGLSRAIASRLPEGNIDIVEPYPTALGKALTGTTSRVRFVPTLQGMYDVIVAQDVLEHVEDPVAIAFALASECRDGGYLVFANCFYPFIRCHLPQTFFLRHTFKFVLAGMGLTFIESIPGAPHALAFQKQAPINLAGGRRRERVARVFGPPINRWYELRNGASNMLRSAL